jgi:hypothetical protein
VGTILKSGLLAIVLALATIAGATVAPVKPGVYNINNPLLQCGTGTARLNCPPPPQLVAASNIIGGVADGFWVDLEPSSGVYSWTELENQIGPWNSANKKTALDVWLLNSDVTTFETTPAWVLAEVAHTVSCTEGTQTFTNYPNVLDANWAPAVTTFLQALLSQYGSDSRIAYIRVGFGASGENNVHCQSQQLAAYGLTATNMAAYIDAMLAVMHGSQGTVQLQTSIACFQMGYTCAPPWTYGSSITSTAEGFTPPITIWNGGLTSNDFLDPTVCLVNWCGFFAQYPSPPGPFLGEQTGALSCPNNTCVTGSLSTLLPFLTSRGASVAEVYAPDLLIAEGVTPEPYGPGLAAAINTFNGAIPGSSSTVIVTPTPTALVTPQAGCITVALAQTDSPPTASYTVTDTTLKGTQNIFAEAPGQTYTFQPLTGGGTASGAALGFVNSSAAGPFNFSLTCNTGHGPIQPAPSLQAGPGIGIAGNWPNQTVSTTGTSSVQNCGTLAACGHTALTGAQIVIGSAALVSASPSTVTITGISPAFTSATSYVCTATDRTSASALKVVNVSGSSFTITGPNTVSDVVNFNCSGN